VSAGRRRTPQESVDVETAANKAAKRRSADFNARIIASLLLFALGGWFVVTQEANFRLGGRDGGTGSRRGTVVDATGVDAVAIGTFIISLGVINLALGMRSERRKTVFWIGAALFLLPIAYGLGKFALDVYQFILDLRAPG
jgi:hypothetical protein